MQKAIEVSMKSGYKYKSFDYRAILRNFEKVKHIILLDSFFWQCLGKSQGWNWRAYVPNFFKYVVMDGGDMEGWFNDNVK